MALALVGVLSLGLPARAAGGVFDSSGAVQVVGSTVVVTADAVEQLDLRWKLATPTDAVAVVVPVPATALIQGAPSTSADDAGTTTAPQRRSLLLRPWILAGEGSGDAIAARDALQAPTQQVRVTEASVVEGVDLAAVLQGAIASMGSAAARDAAVAVVGRALPGSRYAVALLEPQEGSRLQAGWVGTLRLTLRGELLSSPTLPGADGAPTSVSVPLPGGVLGARGPQVVAVTAATAMRAADGDNVAPVVSGVGRAAPRRWQTVMYGPGAGQTAAADVIEAADQSAEYHAVEPVLLPEFPVWPWVLAAAALVGLAGVVLLTRARRRQPSA